MIRWKRNNRWKSFLLIGSFIIVIFIVNRLRKGSCLIEEYRSKLFCFVLIDRESLFERGKVLYETWGHRCGHFKFIYRSNPNETLSIDLPIESFPQLPEEKYEHLTEKVRQTLFHLNQFYPNYRWYFKGDHDTYLIVENLLRLIINDEQTNRIESLLFGYRFREGYYVSGGAGYLLTHRALKLFNKHFLDDQIYSICNSTMEDMMVGGCLRLALDMTPTKQKENLRLIGESIDSNGRERFHPLPFRIHYNGPANKTKRAWIYFRAFHPNIFGFDSVSDTTISFHYTDPEDMYQMDSFLYQIKQFDQHICQHLS